MARRVVTARDQVEMLQPWRESSWRNTPNRPPVPLPPSDLLPHRQLNPAIMTPQDMQQSLYYPVYDESIPAPPPNPNRYYSDDPYDSEQHWWDGRVDYDHDHLVNRSRRPSGFERSKNDGHGFIWDGRGGGTEHGMVERLESGGRLDPVELITNGVGATLTDGNHRLEVADMMSQPTLDTHIHYEPHEADGWHRAPVDPDSELGRHVRRMVQDDSNYTSFDELGHAPGSNEDDWVFRKNPATGLWERGNSSPWSRSIADTEKQLRKRAPEGLPHEWDGPGEYYNWWGPGGQDVMVHRRNLFGRLDRVAAIDEHEGRGIDDLSQEPPEPLWRPGDQVVFGPTGRGTKPVYKLLTVKDVKHARDRRNPEEWWEPGESGWSYSFEHGYQGRLREHYLNSAHSWDGPEATVPKRRPKKAPAVEMMDEGMGEPCPDCDGSGVNLDPYMHSQGQEAAEVCPTCDGHGDLDSAWEHSGEKSRGEGWVDWHTNRGNHPDCGSTHVPIRDMPKPVPGRPHTRDDTSEAHPALEDFTKLPTGSFPDYYDWMHEHTPFYDWPQFSHESVDSFMRDAPEYMTEATGDYWIHDWIDEQEAKGWPAWKGDDHRLPGKRYEVPPEADPRHNRNLLSRLAGADQCKNCGAGDAMFGPEGDRNYCASCANNYEYDVLPDYPCADCGDWLGSRNMYGENPVVDERTGDLVCQDCLAARHEHRRRSVEDEMGVYQDWNPDEAPDPDDPRIKGASRLAQYQWYDARVVEKINRERGK